MPLPFIPETITVHLGPPGSDAQNVTLSFPDYIKNVASSEIYPTWPESAIRANIYAQISFALNRIYTEWYRSQGYDYDITNSTAYDQYFVQGRDIFDNISNIVDEIFNNYLVRQGSVEPLFAQYCSGTTVTCDGLSQWGTVALAEQGMSPYEILTYYYGDNIDIVRDAPVSPNLGSYPGEPLRLGDANEAVRTIQLRLNRISANYPAIPKIYPVNGFFDQNTENAVRTFQQVFGLAVDGVVGKATWYRIAYLFTAIKGLSELSSEGLSLADVTAVYPEQLELGMRAEAVRELQYFLAVIGNYYEEVPILGSIDGIFGQETQEAVIAVQKLFGLPATGIVDEPTWDQITSTYLSILKALPPGWEDAVPLYPGRFLLEGIRGDDVSQLQTMLSTLSTVYPEIPEVPVDGIYGPMTRDAVLAAQALFGLQVSGVVGTPTWAAIASRYMTVVNGSRTAAEQYPGQALRVEDGTGGQA
ncbi:MAG: spore cortex-lytic protein [Clostridiaceae bacterium]|nr:spore cortex-lytic protein [Clostridiaceae bacterium]NBI84363.1 spore cortex-lytic protein [Clostridiaceae bacterium]RKJ61504.1 spore cortex-lytic protein [Butyricicoccus sp. 1XD8-22]